MNDHRTIALQALTTKIQQRSAVCSVIGLGYIGTAFFEAIDDADYVVHGIDRVEAVVNSFTSAHVDGFAKSASSVGTSNQSIAESDIVVVAVRVMPLGDGTVDVSPLEAALATVADCVKDHCLLVVECTLPVGTTRRLVERAFDLTKHTGLFVVHCPERLKIGDTEWPLKRIPHLIGGIDAASTRVGALFADTICDQVIPVSSPEVSELSKLLENAFLVNGITLLGEVTKIAHHHGLSANEVAQAAASKPFGYFPFTPGPGIGGHCLPNDLEVLRRESHQAGLTHSVLDAASSMIDLLPEFVVERLCQVAKTPATQPTTDFSVIANTRVLLIGLGFKIDCPDTTASPAFAIVRRLRELGAHPVFADHFLDSFQVDTVPVDKIDSESLQTSEPIPYGIVLAGDRTIAAALLEDKVDIILDTGGGRIHPGQLTNVFTL